MVQEGMGDTIDSPNSKIYAIQIDSETLYGLYTKDSITDDEIKAFEKGKAYDFSVIIGSSNVFRDEMASLIAHKFGVDKDSITVSNYGFNYRLNP